MYVCISQYIHILHYTYGGIVFNYYHYYHCVILKAEDWPWLPSCYSPCPAGPGWLIFFSVFAFSCLF